MGFSFKGVFGFSECKPCGVSDVISSVLGAEIPLAACFVCFLLAIYSCALVWIGRSLGRRTPLVTIVKIKNSESRFANYGTPRLHDFGKENSYSRNVRGSSGEEEW